MTKRSYRKKKNGAQKKAPQADRNAAAQAEIDARVAHDRRIRQDRIEGEAPALKLSELHGCSLRPHSDTATVADLIAYQNDVGHHTTDVLLSAVECHIAELTLVRRALCGRPEDINAFSEEEKIAIWVDRCIARLEVAMVLDERIKAANAKGGSA